MQVTRPACAHSRHGRRRCGRPTGTLPALTAVQVQQQAGAHWHPPEEPALSGVQGPGQGPERRGRGYEIPGERHRPHVRQGRAPVVCERGSGRAAPSTVRTTVPSCWLSCWACVQTFTSDCVYPVVPLTLLALGSSASRASTFLMPRRLSRRFSVAGLGADAARWSLPLQAWVIILPEVHICLQLGARNADVGADPADQGVQAAEADLRPASTEHEQGRAAARIWQRTVDDL